MNEHALINSLKSGNPLSMRTIFDTHYNHLCRIAFRIVRDRDQAKDVVQTVFIKLWTRRETLDISGSLEVYLKKAVFNTALNHVEHVARKEQEIDQQQVDEDHHVNAPDAEILYSELSVSVGKAIDQLPNRTRAVFTLIRSEEMSYREVAEALQISTKAVEKEMMRALRLLRVTLKHI